jgi:anti-sigma-K factor RskA
VTCAERRDSIFLLAADALEPAEAEALRGHLSTGCPICAGALAEAQATLGEVAGAIAPVAPPLDTLNKLMSRIEKRSREGASDQTQPIRLPATGSRWKIWSTALLSAAAAVAITSAIFWYATRDAMNRTPTLQMVAMNSDTQPKARGVVAWDRDHGQWHVAVFNLAPPPPGKEYELWFVPQGQGKNPVRSKTFTVDSAGSASLIVQVPTDIGPIAAAAITMENAGGVDVPTPPLQLVGAVQ